MSMQIVPGKTDVEACNLDGGGWVVVDESHKTPTNPRLSVAEELELKKRVWKARIVQRKSAGKVVSMFEDEDDELDEVAVEAYASEIEKLRLRLGTHWTWFDEELQSGRHDAFLLGQHSSPQSGPQAPPPAADDAAAFPGLAAGGAKTSLTSRFAPKPRGKQALQERKPVKVQMPSQEVWMAAKEHRKSNFFGAAVIGTAGGSRALFSVLVFTEVGEAVNLGLSSRGFSGELLYAAPGGRMEDLWRHLGASPGALDPHHAGPANNSGVAPPYSGDPAFSTVTWARRRSFVRRVALGTAKPMVVVDSLPELTCCYPELGPFLSASSRERQSGSTDTPDRLLVWDGRQLFNVVDIKRRRVEEVAIDRFASGRLRSSLGAHPSSVTSSWPVRRGKYCETSGGVLTVRCPSTKGSNPKEATAGFQWLELPKFPDEIRVAAAPEPAVADAKSLAAPLSKKSPQSSPAMGPSAHAPHGKKGPASPEHGPARAPVGRKAAQQSCTVPPSPNLLRTLVQKDRIAAQAKEAAAAAPPSLLQVPGDASPPAHVEVEAVWPLPGSRVLMVVRDAPQSSPASGPQRSPAAGPQRSPKVGPMAMGKSPLLGPSSPKVTTATPNFARQASPAEAFEAFELPMPGIAQEASPYDSNLPAQLMQATQAGCRMWLQVWEQPDADAQGRAASPEPCVSVAIASPVTAVDFVQMAEGAEDGAEDLLLLCGLGTGGAELRALTPRPAKGAATLREIRSWAGEASEGPATHVLLRPCANAGAGGTAVVAQASRVQVHSPDAKDAQVRPPAVLPAKGFAGAVRVMALRPVGTRGFAVCTDQQVYAFEVRADASAELVAVVDLPRLAPEQLHGFTGAVVTRFEATPYEFFVVLNEATATGADKNAVCALWPWAGESEGAVRALLGAPGSGHVSRTACPKPLHAWTRERGAAELKEMKLAGLCLNSTLLKSHECPTVGTLALHNPRPVAGRQSGGGGGAGLLALAAPGPGVSVFLWGVEASPEIQRWRERQLDEAALAEKRHEIEHKRFKLNRLKQRLQETEKLEEKAKEKGEEALTEEEQAKLQRKPQVETEIDRLSNELQIEDAKNEEEASSEEGSDYENDYLSGGKDEAVERQKRRHQKELEQKAHHENKRNQQKERRKNRDSKFGD